MAGIVSYGAYIPYWRLSRNLIRKGLKGEKAVSSFDEDSITMAVAAAIDCLRGIERRSVDGIFFASNTSPYREKQAAATIAMALDLRRDIRVADFGNSLRAGTSALRSAADAVKAGSAGQILVVAADCRLGEPESFWEQNCGDAAAALLVGSSELASEIEYDYSIYDEILDVWRSADDRYIRYSESRFVGTEGYIKLTREAISGLMEKYDLNVKDIAKAVLALPVARRQVELAKSLKIDAKTQLQDSLLSDIGDSGAAYSLILLVSALEEAKPNDRILLASYGNGSDAMTFKITDKTKTFLERRGIKGHISRKKMLTDYLTYLKWRGIVTTEKPPFALGQLAPTALWRERDQNIRLYGSVCNECGTVQYPPQKVCIRCRTKGNVNPVRLSDKKSKLFTYSIDYGTWSPQIPSITCIINFEGGGRLKCLMTDWESIDEVKVGMPLEMTFRKLDFREGIHHYIWKAIPIRN